MNINFDDQNEGLKKLKEALVQLNRRECARLLPDESEAFRPSRKHLRSMENLIRKQSKIARKPRNALGKRVAALPIAASLIFALSMNVSAVRSSVTAFFTIIHEKFVEIIFSEKIINKAPDTIETRYTLEYIPSGYEQVEYIIKDTKIWGLWRDKNGSEIIFYQVLYDASIIKDSEQSDYQEFEHNGKTVSYASKHGIQDYVWYNSQYIFSLTISSTFSREECLKIINSLAEYKNSSNTEGGEPR